MGSSLPNHDAKGWKKQTEKKPKKEKQRKPKAYCIRQGQREKKNIENMILYDA